MLKVMTVFGTRPEGIKMAPVVKAMQARPDAFKPVVCVTGQHREMLDQVLNRFGICPDHDLDIMTPDQTLADITARVLSALDVVLKVERPHWVLVQGDTTTAMAAAMAAFYRRIPVGHVEAGLRTDDKYQPYPEEINRRIISVTANMHFAPTEWAADNLRRERVREEHILVTGNTVIDAIREIATGTVGEPALPPGVPTVRGKRLILVTAHRRENFGEGIRQICVALREIAEAYDDVHLVYPVHLNPNIAGPVHAALGGVRNITLLPPLEYGALVGLMKRCYIVISDSGGIQEEAPGLGVPVLLLRDTTERPEGVLAGTVRLVGSDVSRIVSAARELLDDRDVYQAMAGAINPYGDGRAANRIVDWLRAEAQPEKGERRTQLDERSRRRGGRTEVLPAGVLIQSQPGLPV